MSTVCYQASSGQQFAEEARDSRYSRPC